MDRAGDVQRFESNLLLRVRDGVGLATDIYRPARHGVPFEEPLPILLQRTPYDKTSERFVATADFFCRHGYIVALQDIRGRYASEGVFSKYGTDAEDGYDTIARLAALPYCDGQIGMWGTSYAAHTQADAAKLSPPALKTIVLNMGGFSDGWDHKIRNHGAFELVQQLSWAFSELAKGTNDPVVRAMLERESVGDWLTRFPLRKGLNPLSIAPNFEDYLLQMATHADAGDWRGIGTSWLDYYDGTADIPMLHMSGWYDTYAGGTVRNYLELSERKRGPVRLIVGPWTHSGNLRSYSGDVEFGPQATLTGFEREFHLRWFDRFLKGSENGVEHEAPVRLFVMGSGDGHRDEHGRLVHGGNWRDASGWPLPGTAFTPYYLHADGSLTMLAPSPDEPDSTTYTHDPAHPVPTIGGSFTGISADSPALSGGFDQREGPQILGSQPPYLPLKSRPDVLVFQTEPLQHDVTLIGPIVVKLFAASTALDTDFTAKLVDVYPPSADYPSGFDLNLTDGIIRARYRESPDHPALLEPGKTYEFTIEPFPTANRFKRGHRIRLDIASSNFPRFDVNPNTGEPLGQHRRAIPADNTVFHSAEFASHVVLPVVES
jgi:uncharacterized protein